MRYFAGIDAGSTYVKAALIDENKVVGVKVANTGIDNVTTVRRLLEELALGANIKFEDISFTMATGYSRRGIEIANDNISEITAHAYGVRLTAPEGVRPRLIIDIGGQDSKVISLDENIQVNNFVMNDKCAAGTGKFIEVIAGLLETTIDQVGPLSLESISPCDINSTCVVFAQSEVISLMARKIDRKDILAGMHMSMAKRVAKMARKFDVNVDVLMTGGGALNSGLHSAFEDELMADIFVANYPQFNGAIGAALIGKERAE